MMPKRPILFISFLVLILGACNLNEPTEIAETTPSVEIIAAEEPIPVIADGRKIVLYAESSPPNAIFFWSIERGVGTIEDETEESIYYVAPQTIDAVQQDIVTVTVTDAEGNSASDRIIIQLVPATPDPAKAPELDPTEVPNATDTPEPAAPLTPTETPVPVNTPTPTAVPPTTEPPTEGINALRTDQAPTIDGRFDEAIWLQAEPLIFATHPDENDTTTSVVRLLWDEQFIYAAFDVTDSQVEQSSVDTPFDGDSVSFIIELDDQVYEYRHSVPADGNVESAIAYKEGTTLDDTDDQDTGFTVEMRIPWPPGEVPATGTVFLVDFLSVDHDLNPGTTHNAAGTVFSKISWDEDGRVDSALNSLTLVSNYLTNGTAVSITTLENDAMVARSMSPVGNYAPEIEDDIWVLIGLLGDKLYPQSPNACAGESARKINGRWEVPVGIGNPNDTGAIFEIIVYTANQADSQLLADTITRWCLNNDYPGLERNTLPEGLVEHQRLTVTRKAEDLGAFPPISQSIIPGTATIDNVEAGDILTQSFFLNGNVSDGLEGNIWVFVYGPNGRFYPQSENACSNQHTILSENTWQVHLSLGGAEDSGRAFNLITVQVDAYANAFFEEIQQEWCRNGSYPGLLSLELPQGIEVEDFVWVIRE